MVAVCRGSVARWEAKIRQAVQLNVDHKFSHAINAIYGVGVDNSEGSGDAEVREK